MARCGAGDVGGIPSVHEHAAHKQRFRHRGACAVKADEGNAELARGEISGNDLIEKIPAKQNINFIQRKAGLFNRPLHDVFKHLALGKLPCVFAPGIVLEHHIEKSAQRAFALYFADDRFARDDFRGIRKRHRLAADAFAAHKRSPSE
jgi:hypothetical protein